MAKIRLRRQQAGKMRRKHGCAPKHDPEKWEPVFGKDHARKKHDPEKWEPVFGKIMLKQKAGAYDASAKSHRILAARSSAAMPTSEKI
jgi:hypothetical protein